MGTLHSDVMNRASGVLSPYLACVQYQHMIQDTFFRLINNLKLGPIFLSIEIRNFDIR